MKRRLQISLIIIVIAILLVACAPEADQAQEPAQVTVGEPFEIHQGEVVTIGEGNVQISVAEFVEDSRCPMNARCIVAGQAVVRVRVDGEVVALGLWSDDVPSKVALADGYTLELLEVNPFPGSLEEASGSPQSVRLVVTGQES